MAQADRNLGASSPKALEACLLERGNLQAILDSVADGILTVGEDLCISHFNRAAETITGFPAREAVGQPCPEILHRLLAGGCFQDLRFLEGERIPAGGRAGPDPEGRHPARGQGDGDPAHRRRAAHGHRRHPSRPPAPLRPQGADPPALRFPQPHREVPPDAGRLPAYPWPGNCRELENTIEHAFVCCPGGHFTLAHLPGEVVAPEAIAASASSPPNPLKTAEREVLIRALQDAKGNQAAAAQAVGLARNTLWRKLKRYGIDPRTIKER